MFLIQGRVPNVDQIKGCGGREGKTGREDGERGWREK